MAWRLGELVVRGEVFNLRRNSVHGWLELRDQEQPLHFELTGNCGDGLAGRHFRFTMPEPNENLHDESTDDLDLTQLEPMQVGPTGDMLLKQVKVPRCSIDEYIRRSGLGEDLPCDEKTCLYLEWYSQNGRMVLEIVDPVLEFVDGPNEAYLTALQTEVDRDGEDRNARGAFVANDANSDEDEADDDDEESDEFDPLADSNDSDSEDDDEDDPYGLFPEDLDEQLSAASDAEGQLGEYPIEVDEETRKQWALWDEMFEGKHDVPIQTIFDPPLRIYPHDKLDDTQVAEALRTVLARLAEYGIALDMCQHYTPRDAYRLLLEEILPKHGTYPKLRATGFVQHYMTSEFCEKCEAEFEEEWQQREKERLERGETFEPPPDDELPF